MTAAQVRPLHPEPSYSEDAEQAVLSAMLMEAAAIDSARQILTSESFYSERHKRIFLAMLEVADTGAAVDPMTLTYKLADRGELDAAGGKDYIGYLVDAVPTAANVEYHAGIVQEKFEAREAFAQLAHAADQVRGGRALAVVRRQLEAVLDTIAPRSVGTTALRLYDDVAIEELPDAAYTVQNTAYEDSIVVLYGKYATLKTFVLLDVAFCIGTGRPWHGRAVRQGAVIYIYAEGRAGIKKRVRAWKAANGHEGTANVYFLPTALRLTELAEVSRLIRLIERTVQGPVRAVFIDTVARNMAGNEDKVEDMNRFVAGCDTVRAATNGATIFAAHHEGWSAARSRGSTSLPGAANTELRVERDDLTLTITCSKQKDGIEEDANITLEAFPVAGSLALRAVVPNRAELTRNERKALAVVQASDGLTFSEWRDGAEQQTSSFNNARKRLLALVYVRLIKGKYGATETGKLALGTSFKGTTKEVQPPRPEEVQHALSPIGESVVPGEAREQ